AQVNERENYFRNLVHDLRSPLSVIVAAADYLQKSKMPETANNALQSIHRASNRALWMADCLVLWEKINKGFERQEFEVKEFLMTAVEDLQWLGKSRDKCIGIHLANYPQVKVKSNRDMLFRVLQNL